MANCSDLENIKFEKFTILSHREGPGLRNGLSMCSRTSKNTEKDLHVQIQRVDLAYLAAVNRVPLTPPKQLADTNIGIKNQNIPIIFFAKVYGIKFKLNIKLNKLEKERVVN